MKWIFKVLLMFSNTSKALLQITLVTSVQLQCEICAHLFQLKKKNDNIDVALKYKEYGSFSECNRGGPI